MDTMELNWKVWLTRGNQYLRAASPKSEKSRFNTDIRYNLLSMGMESYIMAILDYHNTLPDNHTYTDLIMALENVVPIKKTLKNRILKYENIQSICSIEKYHRTSPSEADLTDLHGAIVQIAEIAVNICKNVA